MISQFFKKLVTELRKLKFVNLIANYFLSNIAWLVIRIISSSLQVHRINFDKVKQLKNNVIYAFFHGEQFVLVFSHRHTNIVIMTSYSPDGELQTMILKKFGYDIVRGSSGKKGATSGTLKIIEKLLNGQDCAFAVDGPHGPGFKVKPGVVFLAQKTKKPIIPVRVFIQRKIMLKNWDRYILPLPFSKSFIVYGEPFYISENDNIKKKTLELEQTLKSLNLSSYSK
ncbi:MAG: lysophospholipid acyltransferase family protein [Endomicrobia bacterium]|nr:lysophospholipid acyltransferase family protein [Endomicrobiia bacterium]